MGPARVFVSVGSFLPASMACFLIKKGPRRFSPIGCGHVVREGIKVMVECFDDLLRLNERTTKCEDE